jgi:hypothetical protein
MSRGVFVYRNLNRKGVVWSVKSRKTGLVVARRGFVVVKDAELYVSARGNERVRREGRKNVHAGVRGTWYRCDPMLAAAGAMRHKLVRIRYNPRENTSFVVASTGRPVKSARYVFLDSKGAYAIDPK